MKTKQSDSLRIISIIAMMFLYAMIAFVTNLAAPVGKIWGESFTDPAQAERMGMLGNLFNFLAYLIMGIPAGNLLSKYGYKRTALAAIALIRSATYHFAEPLVYRFGMRTRHAWLYIAALFLRHPLSFLGYYLALAILHLALWAAVGAILLGFAIATLPVAMFAAPLAAAFAAFLPALARFAAIPFLYTLRCAGPRFLDAWRKDLR